MAFQGWVTFGDSEIANVSRTVQLARAMGISSVRLPETTVDWIENAFTPAPPDYGMIENAPWYDAAVPASAEFAGIIPLSISGLDDSTLASQTTEYVTNGGNSSRPRHSTLPLVWDVVLVASSEEGADYGLRWLKHRLSTPDFGGPSCAGPALRYFAHDQKDSAETPPIMHRNRVRLTRGLSVARRRSMGCGVLVFGTFTMTASDPFEYGEQIPWAAGIGGTAAGDGVEDSGTVVLTEQPCPVYDYSPIYDPLFPALVAPPAPPMLRPLGWGIEPGMNFQRHWVELKPVVPEGLSLAPVVLLSSDTEARMVRVSLFEIDGSVPDAYNDLCGAVWTTTVTYLPVDYDLVVDGEANLTYAWDGANSRLATSLAYSGDARPMDWVTVNGEGNSPGKGFLIALDLFESDTTTSGYEGDGDVRAALAFVPKSD